MMKPLLKTKRDTGQYQNLTKVMSPTPRLPLTISSWKLIEWEQWLAVHASSDGLQLKGKSSWRYRQHVGRDQPFCTEISKPWSLRCKPWSLQKGAARDSSAGFSAMTMNHYTISAFFQLSDKIADCGLSTLWMLKHCAWTGRSDS